MNLLVVEDERITREGLLECLDWSQVGITKVFNAEDGETGLRMAKRVLPDIVLTDIRMPRMDGITMATRIREILPECRIIFLSAYSEIDYYKAAIDLKAIRYLDKPIEAEQLQTVISIAVAECMQLRSYKSTSNLHNMQERQRFADAICTGEHADALESEYTRLKLGADFSVKDYCTAMIISIRQDFEDEDHNDLHFLATSLSKSVIYPNLFTIRSKNRIVLLLFASSEISRHHMNVTCKNLHDLLSDHVYVIAVGNPFKGLANAHKAYTSAKTVLHKAYLYPWGQVVHHSEDAEKAVPISAYAKEKSEISRNISEGNEKESYDACDVLYKALATKRDLTHYKARELYFELISEVFHKADSSHLQIKDDEMGEAISWIVLIESYNLDELHSFLCRHISLYFKSLEEAKNEKKQVLAIKAYIAKNFMDATLSIGDISGYLHMSASHVCTTFKRETGDTINNYLTEYRLSKAKQYLQETLLTVTEISIKVGYRDNSYFGKIFRKHFGMTPNEYRNW
ncbi:MAG: response regulator [Clostridiales bacterium]|jgi:two-component system response regulator YesN|nr:response regulator [Clostridiales bacterium]